MEGTQMETWKPVIGYENLYEVSDLGNVRSVDRYIDTNIKHVTRRLQKGRILSQNLKKNGYMTVDLCKNGKIKTTLVHRIVADAFLQEDGKRTINHIDGDKTNNAVCNLERSSHSENIKHAFKTGLSHISWTKGVFSPDIPRYFTDADYAAEWIMSQGLGKTKETVANNIRRCCRGLTKKAYGFTWIYTERSTTIPKGSRDKRPEMGNTPQG